MEISLIGKRAFVTAGGDGMGRTTAITMDKLGAEVFTCDVDPTGLATLPDSITTWECDLIVFLVSDYGRHISGQLIGVDGNTETLYPRS